MLLQVGKLFSQSGVYLAANGITEPDRKCSVLLSVCRGQALLTPAKLVDMFYRDILTILEHFSAQLSVIA